MDALVALHKQLNAQYDVAVMTGNNKVAKRVDNVRDNAIRVRYELEELADEIGETEEAQMYWRWKGERVY